MKLGRLVEWDGEWGVGRAKDVSAVPTMVFANEETERRTALWRVAGR
jgi:hypothetical protein